VLVASLARAGLTTLIALTACQSVVPAPATPHSEVDEVTAQIGDAACTADSQCRTIGVGSKACGGFERYLAWSTLRTDAQALGRAAERQRAREDKLRASAADPMLSNCALVPDPGAFCADSAGSSPASAARICRLRRGSGGAASALY